MNDKKGIPRNSKECGGASITKQMSDFYYITKKSGCLECTAFKNSIENIFHMNRFASQTLNIARYASRKRTLNANKTEYKEMNLSC